MIVVDTNVIAYLLIPGDRTQAADQLFQKDSDWLSPTLWRHEFLNVLSLYVRKGLLSVDQADGLDVRAQQVVQVHLQTNAKRVPELSMQSNCSSYDCEFVALAQELNLPLVTVDQRGLRAFLNPAVSLDA